MATDVQPDAGPITGNVLFYSHPEPLSSETHAKLGLRRIDAPFAFAASSHIVPLTVTEFQLAAISYPIIFAGDKRQPLAVMGVTGGTNLFIGQEGLFAPGAYMPAYIRRYPFVLANDTTREKLVVCIDRAAPMLGELPDLAFFDSKGDATDYTKNCIQFCNDFEAELRRTESFVNLLNDLDLFETRSAMFTPTNADGSAGTPQSVAEYFAVSEEKLKALPDSKLREFLTNGALTQIFAHLTSLNGWDRLIAMAVTRQSTTPRPANLN